MWIVFEGIDGCGKTTISTRVAERLRGDGLTVEHMREDAMYSRVTHAIRELGRDSAHLTLTPRAELLLYLAREVQVFEEAIEPALARADVVICDRCVYTPEVLAVHGRGLAPEDVATLTAGLVAGRTPDLTILIDVDPQIARARRRVAKIVRPSSRRRSRKGLAGAGLQHRLRAGYLERAEREPSRWMVVDNTEAELASVVAHVSAAVRAAVHSGSPAPPPATARARRAPTAARTRDEVVPRFVAWLDRCAAREPALAAYFLAGLAGDDVDQHRLILAERAPEVMAWGLRGLGDRVSWRLRRLLAERAPGPIARSLAGVADDSAARLRTELAPIVPVEVAASLSGLDSAHAWALRDDLFASAPDAVVASLGHLTAAATWDTRLWWLDAQGGPAELHRASIAAVACQSIAGLDDETAWHWRTLCLDVAPVSALASLAGLVDERAWQWRQQYLHQAPKVIMKTLAGLDDPRAWALRDAVATRCKETLDSMHGLDTPAAWRIRERCADVWPSTVVKSLGRLVATDHGRTLLTRQVARHGDDPSLLRHAVAYALEPSPARRAAIAGGR